jgi:beta-ribofuranosylaminobenzene 5'-phosphate synthase
LLILMVRGREYKGRVSKDPTVDGCGQPSTPDPSTNTYYAAAVTPHMARVTARARLHLGFRNLSLSRPWLYGGIGVALDRPRTVVRATPADHITVDGPPASATAARRTVEYLDVSGANVAVERALPRHVGLGSGTQLALAVAQAIATAHEASIDVRDVAPLLGRGGRSGVGVATFERGGVVIDRGHPSSEYSPSRPPDGSWTVPPVTTRLRVPASWRFLLVRPQIESGIAGDAEEASIRRVVECASVAPAAAIDRVVGADLLPAVRSGDVTRFGLAAGRIDRLNGQWFAPEQAGVHRETVREICRHLAGASPVAGAGQSSWGPTVYGVTPGRLADRARAAGERALEAAGVDGHVRVAAGYNHGARIES